LSTQPPFFEDDEDALQKYTGRDASMYGKRDDDLPVVRRIRRPVEHEPDEDEDDEVEESEPAARRVTRSSTPSDPTFGLLISFALNIGLAALGPSYGDLRFIVAWGSLAFFAVLAWLLGTTNRIGRERPENLAWGVVFGVMIGAPLLVVGGSTLQTTVGLIFRTASETQGLFEILSPGAVLAFVVFVQPLGETLFLRGLFQAERPFWLAGLVGTIWSLLLFLPMIEVNRFPLIAILIGSALALMNMMYSYVCRRNSLAAAWLCQITVNVLVFALPAFGLR
jgi:hypothetical protein